MTCPICGKDSDRKVRPFCSRRCADIDLSRWFSGSYSLPSEDPSDAEDLDDLLGAGAAEKRGDFGKNKKAQSVLFKR